MLMPPMHDKNELLHSFDVWKDCKKKLAGLNLGACE